MTIPTTNEIEAHLHELIRRTPIITIRLDIINKCNLRCIMCQYSDQINFSRPVKYVTPEDFDRLFKDISPYVNDVMLSCSDEPLTSKYFPEILHMVATYPPQRKISLCTNAMLMSQSVSRLFIENGVTSILLSMDGVTKSTYERIRAGSKYERVVGNIKMLRDLKKASGSKYPTMIMNFVMMNANIHEAPLFVDMARQLGVETVDFRHVVPTEYWHDEKDMLSSHKSKYNYYREKIIEASSLHKINVNLPPPFDIREQWKPGVDVPHVDLSDFEHVKGNQITDEILRSKEFPPDFESENIAGTIHKEFSNIYCHRPFTDIQLVEDKIKCCPWLKTSLGSLSDGKSLFEIFIGEEYQNLRRNMYLTNGDPNCEGCIEKSDFFGLQKSSTKTQQNLFKSLSRKITKRLKRVFYSVSKI